MVEVSQCVGVRVVGGGVTVCGCEGGGCMVVSQCVGVMVGGGGVKVCGCEGGGWWRFHSVWV